MDLIDNEIGQETEPHFCPVMVKIDVSMQANEDAYHFSNSTNTSVDTSNLPNT